MNIAKLMKQAQQMQADMQKMQAELALRSYEVSVGGGAVKAVASGDGELKSLTIAPDLVKGGDVEMIQDLVLSAVQEASKQAKEAAAKEMGKMTSGMGLPGF
jgi:DNA-binding YbaB/EbfC family protein